MKHHWILPCCALAFLFSTPAASGHGSCELGSQMEALDDAYKALRKETDPAKGAALARDAQQATLKSLMETPDTVGNLPDGPEKDRAAAQYRRMMGRLYPTLCEVEEAFLDGKTEEVAKLVLTLKELRKAGHDKFMEDE
jgi:soluble cytochrome b562